MYIISFIHPTRRIQTELVSADIQSLSTIIDLLDTYNLKFLSPSSPKINSIHFTVYDTSGNKLYPKHFGLDETDFWKNQNVFSLS